MQTLPMKPTDIELACMFIMMWQHACGALPCGDQIFEAVKTQCPEICTPIPAYREDEQDQARFLWRLEQATQASILTLEQRRGMSPEEIDELQRHRLACKVHDNYNVFSLTAAGKAAAVRACVFARFGPKWLITAFLPPTV